MDGPQSTFGFLECLFGLREYSTLPSPTADLVVMNVPLVVVARHSWLAVQSSCRCQVFGSLSRERNAWSSYD